MIKEICKELFRRKPKWEYEEDFRANEDFGRVIFTKPHEIEDPFFNYDHYEKFTQGLYSKRNIKVNGDGFTKGIHYPEYKGIDITKFSLKEKMEFIFSECSQYGLNLSTLMFNTEVIFISSIVNVLHFYFGFWGNMYSTTTLKSNHLFLVLLKFACPFILILSGIHLYKAFKLERKVNKTRKEFENGKDEVDGDDEDRYLYCAMNFCLDGSKGGYLSLFIGIIVIGLFVAGFYIIVEQMGFSVAIIPLAIKNGILTISKWSMISLPYFEISAFAFNFKLPDYETPSDAIFFKPKK